MIDPSFGVLLAATAAAAVVVGFLKTSIGGGIGLVLTPTLTLVLPAPMVLGLVAPLMNLSDPLTLRYYWRQWDARHLRLLMPTTLAGILLGSWLLSALSDTGIKRAIGVVALTFAVAQLVMMLLGRQMLGARPHWTIGVAAGLVNGVASAVAHSGGVVLWMYLLGAGAPPAIVVGTGAALVTVSNVVKLVAYWKIGFLTARIVLAAVLSLPLLALGAWLGYRVNRWLPRRAFELLIIAIAIVGSLRLLMSR